MSKHSLITGLSLFELLVVLLLLSILFAFGLPFTTQWSQRQLAWIMQKDIEQAIEYAKQESLLLGEPLRLVPLRNHDWSTGLELLKEHESLASAPSILYTWPWRQSHIQVVWHGFLSDAYLRFTPDLSQMALNGYFLIEEGAQQRIKIMLNRVGRVREGNDKDMQRR